MSIKVMGYVWEHSKQSGAHLLVLLAIADSANDDGFCWLAMPKIAKKARQDASNTRQYIQKIEWDGEVIVYERRSENGETQQHSNLYKVVMPGTSDETPPDLRGRLKRRLPKAPRPRKTKGTGNITPTPPPIDLPVPPSQNYGADPLDDPSPSFDPEKKKDSPPEGGTAYSFQDEPESPDSKPPGKPKALTPAQAAREALNEAVWMMLGGKLPYPQTAKWVNFLTGETPEKSASGKRNGDWFSLQVQPGMTADEIGALGRWHRDKTKGKDIYATCENVSLEVGRFRADPHHDGFVERYRLDREAREDLAARGGDQGDPEPEEDAPPMSEEQRQEVQARLNALRDKMGGGK